MPGVGKTVLALRLAHQLTAEGYYSDAQLFVDLKGTAPEPVAPAQALTALLTALLGPDPQRPDDEDTLSHLWRQALQTRRALLVLDNAAGAAQVRPLLPGSAGPAVIITSQHHFTLPGAERFELGPLPQAEASAFLQALAPRLTAEEADELASLVGRLPLALRVASNNLALNDDLVPADYVAAARQEASRLDLLSDPGEPGLDVGTSLSAGIGGCGPITRHSWALLGCLPAPFTVAAAAALWGDGDSRTAWQPLADSEARNRLRSLRHMSLVAYDPETDRFGQHVLLRLTAGRALDEAADVTSARQRLACHFLTVAQAIDATQRYMDLDRDWPHLRSALEHTRLQDRELFSGLVLALNNCWSARGMARERATWNERAAKAYAATRSDVHLAPPPAAQSAADLEGDTAGAGASELSGQRKVGVHLGHVGAAYYEMGQPQRAIEVYGQAIYASRSSGDQAAEADHLNGVGRAYAALGDTERAVDYQHQAIDLHRAAGNAQGEMTALGALGQAYVRLGEARRGIGYLQRAVAMAQGLEDHRAEGLWLGELALAYTELGDLYQAIQNQEQALSCVRSAGDLPGEATQLASLGWTYARLGNGAPPAPGGEEFQALDAAAQPGAREALARAQEHWHRAVAIFEALADPRSQEVRGWLAELQA
jgi:tetratricopeptide (TPR) repeat protein